MKLNYFSSTRKRLFFISGLICLIIAGLWLCLISRQDLILDINRPDFRTVMGKVIKEEHIHRKISNEIRSQCCVHLPEYIDKYTYRILLPSGRIVQAEYSVDGPGGWGSGNPLPGQLLNKWIVMEGGTSGEDTLFGVSKINKISTLSDFYYAIARYGD